jgi:hypothetical protein
LWDDHHQRHAVAQIALAADGRRRWPWVSAGAAATLPGQAAALIAELTLLGAGCGGLSAPGAETPAARLPLHTQWCRDLGGTGIRFTVPHEDLHSNNICLAGPSKDPMSDLAVNLLPAVPEARTWVIDWGDASIGHPFAPIPVALRFIAHHRCCEVSDKRVQRTRHAYLGAFTTCAPCSELIAVADVAQRVGAAARAWSWRAALLSTPTPVHGEYDFPMPGQRQELPLDPRRP